MKAFQLSSPCYVESASFDTIGVTFVENMKAFLGISVKMERCDFATLLRRTDDTFDYDMTMLGWGSPDASYDPSGSSSFLAVGNFINGILSSPELMTDWEARIDELIGLQEQTLDEANV